MKKGSMGMPGVVEKALPGIWSLRSRPPGYNLSPLHGQKISPPNLGGKVKALHRSIASIMSISSMKSITL